MCECVCRDGSVCGKRKGEHVQRVLEGQMGLVEGEMCVCVCVCVCVYVEIRGCGERDKCICVETGVFVEGEIGMCVYLCVCTGEMRLWKVRWCCGGVCVEMGLLCLSGHTRRVWVRHRCVFAWKERWVCVCVFV